MMVPVVGTRKEPVHLEIARQALTETVEGLYVVVGPVDILMAMPEVDVGCDKRTVWIEEAWYFGKLLGLEFSDILEKALSQDDIESLVIEPDRILEKIGLDEVRCRIMYGYVYAVVFYIRRKQAHQGGGPATDIEQGTLFTLRQGINNSRRLLHSEVRPTVIQVLVGPEFLLVILYRFTGVIPRDHSLTAGRVVHKDLLE